MRLTTEKPEFAPTIDNQIAELSAQWTDLEKTTEEKGQKLFDANRQQLYVQSIADMEEWAQQLEQQVTIIAQISWPRASKMCLLIYLFMSSLLRWWPKTRAKT